MEGEEEDSKVGLVVEQVHLPPIANKKALKKGSSGEGSQDESEEGRAKSLEKKKDWHKSIIDEFPKTNMSIFVNDLIRIVYLEDVMQPISVKAVIFSFFR